MAPSIESANFQYNAPQKKYVKAVTDALRTAGIVTLHKKADHVLHRAAEYRVDAPLWPLPMVPGRTLYQCPWPHEFLGVS